MYNDDRIWRHILSPLLMLIYAGTRGTYCRPKAYIVAGIKFLPSLYCRRRKYVPNSAEYIVAPHC